MNVGSALRSAREQRGVSLESLSRITRIKPDLLRAIEENDFSKVPGGIFRRGFLRSYAREVGLDPEMVVRTYRDEFEPEAQPESPAPLPERAVHTSPSLAADVVPFDVEWLRPGVNVQWMAVALIVASFASYTILAPRLGARGSRATLKGDTAGVSALAQPGVLSPKSGAVGTSGSPLQVDIAPTGPCWIVAKADGQEVAYGLLQPGDHRSIRVRDGLVLRVGDPAAFSYKINGVPGRQLGRPAEPVTVTIAPHNFRDFLTSARPAGS